MKINGVNSYYSVAQNARTSRVKKVESPIDNQKVSFVALSFKGNPSKHPNQIAAYATESNFLGGIYQAGGLGDVAEAAPEAIGLHGKEIIGKNVDIRTFLPYYSFDDGEGKIYVVKNEKEVREKLENFNTQKKNIETDFKSGKINETVKNQKMAEITEKFGIKRSQDFIKVDQNYKLKNGESFALITQGSGKGAENVTKMFFLKDVNLSGQVDRVAKDSFDMEKVPYRIFELESNGRPDKMYLIHTPEMASGKSAYGIYDKYKKIEEANSSKGYGGTRAYGGGYAYGGSRAYGGSAAYGGSSAYGGLEAGQNLKYFEGRMAGDMFYTEQLRGMGDALEKMGNANHGDFVPQNIMLHDRFAYSMLSDAVEKMPTNEYWRGIRYVPIFHNPGRTYQGVMANPVDFFKVIATKEDLEKLKSNPNFKYVQEIDNKIAKHTASAEECTKLYNFFKPYFEKYLDSEGCFNITKIAIATADEYPENCVPGNVSRYYGKETRNFETEDIAKGLTQSLIDIENKTVDVVNGAKPANMNTSAQDGFFGSGTLNDIFKDIKSDKKYTPYKATDDIEKIFDAKKSNKKNLINIIADATNNLEKDKDAVAKVFFADHVMKDNRGKDANLKLTLGGLSPYKEGDVLFLSWGRPDPQKGLKVTARAFRKYLEDESIPLETRMKSKLLFGAGKDVFRDGNSEWKGIQEEIEKIENIEIGGKKGIFKGNACYVNGLFPNRLANCADASIFTSRWEPCGITPFESFATGTPVINVKSGGAPDFITTGKTGLLTNDAFMLSAKKLNLPENTPYEALDEARVEHCATDTANVIKQYTQSIEDKTFEVKQKEYMKNCLNEKIEWHNNNKYNGGKSALELYLKEKFRTQDNEVGTAIRTNARGEFDNAAFTGKKYKAGKLGEMLHDLVKGRGKMIAGASLGAVALAGFGIAGYKSGWFSPKFDEQTKAGEFSQVV